MKGTGEITGKYDHITKTTRRMRGMTKETAIKMIGTLEMKTEERISTTIDWITIWRIVIAEIAMNPVDTKTGTGKTETMIA
jgi:hypothetical protein